MHSSVRVDVLCVENSHGGHVVIGVGIVHRPPRKHNIPVIGFSLLVHFCTCSQTVCCDRQFFPVAIYCTLLHRENGSFEVLCLHTPAPDSTKSASLILLVRHKKARSHQPKLASPCQKIRNHQEPLTTTDFHWHTAPCKICCRTWAKSHTYVSQSFLAAEVPPKRPPTRTVLVLSVEQAASRDISDC